MSDLTGVITPALIPLSGANQGETANDIFKPLSPFLLFGERADGMSGLTWGGFGSDRFYIDSVPVTKANWTQAITGSATRYMSISRAGTITEQASAFKTTDFPLRKFITSASAITTDEDHRDIHNYIRFAYGILTKAMADANQTLTALESMCESIIATGTLTATRDIIVPAVPRSYCVKNGCTGGSVRVISTSGTGITIAVGGRGFLEFDGTNVIELISAPAVTFVAPRVTAVTTGGTHTIDANTTDQFHVNGADSNLTFNAPSGSPVSGQSLLIRIVDDGTSRTLTFNAAFRAVATLPVATTPNKVIYIGAFRNTNAGKWDVVSVREEL